MITMLIAMKIAEFYPDNCRLMSIYDDKLNKYSAAVVEFDKRKGVGDTLYALDEFTYDSEKDALIEINNRVLESQRPVKIMSN